VHGAVDMWTERHTSTERHTRSDSEDVSPLNGYNSQGQPARVSHWRAESRAVHRFTGACVASFRAWLGTAYDYLRVRLDRTLLGARTPMSSHVTWSGLHIRKRHHQDRVHETTTWNSAFL
jgi:hypothetical protein